MELFGLRTCDRERQDARAATLRQERKGDALVGFRGALHAAVERDADAIVARVEKRRDRGDAGRVEAGVIAVAHHVVVIDHADMEAVIRGARQGQRRALS